MTHIRGTAVRCHRAPSPSAACRCRCETRRASESEADLRREGEENDEPEALVGAVKVVPATLSVVHVRHDEREGNGDQHRACLPCRAGTSVCEAPHAGEAPALRPHARARERARQRAAPFPRLDWEAPENHERRERERERERGWRAERLRGTMRIEPPRLTSAIEAALHDLGRGSEQERHQCSEREQHAPRAYHQPPMPCKREREGRNIRPTGVERSKGGVGNSGGLERPT